MTKKIEIQKLFLSEDMKLQIAQLRQTSYEHKFGARVAPNGLSWNNHDDDSFHFGAIENGVLVSTIRLTRILTESRFDSMMQFSSEDPFAVIPCFALSRAATLPEKKGQALNMKLRILVYRFLIQNGAPAQYLYGTALGGSLRLKFLEDLGYEMKFHDQPWKGYLDSTHKNAAIFRIPISRLSAAIEAIESSQARR